MAARGRRFPRVQAAQDPWGGDALRSGGRRSRPTRFWSEISRRRRFVPSFPSLQVFHQAVNLECHLAGGRSRHLSLSTCRWHIDARRPLVPSSDPPFSPPPSPAGKLRPTISTANIIQQNHSSSRSHWSALPARETTNISPKGRRFIFWGLIPGWTKMARASGGR